LLCDLFDSGVEVVQGDLGDRAVGVFRWRHCEMREVEMRRWFDLGVGER
jgi:hypothetical protein